MRNMNPKEYKLFEKIVSLDQKTLKRYMATYLRKIYPKVLETKDYICAEGVIPIALVAHMDTVFFKPATTIYYDRQKNTMWSPMGLGADDRAGVFAIIQILQSGLRPHIIFTTDEEKGCLGAEVLAKTECPFQELKYIIELDRRGTQDCVFYDCDNEEFVDFVEKYGFLENWGSFSDISEICPLWKVAGVNLSIGYDNEHSEIETLNVSAMFSTIDKVKQMLIESTEAPYFKYIPNLYYYDWILKRYGKSTYTCKCCQNEFPEIEIFMAKGKDNTVSYYCTECAQTNMTWCHFCNEPFETKDMTRTICYDCEEKANDTVSGEPEDKKPI